MEETIYCSNCVAPLVTIIKSPQKVEANKFVVNCAHCGDRSNAVPIEHKLYIGSTEYTLFADMETKPSYIIVNTEVQKPWKKK